MSAAPPAAERLAGNLQLYPGYRAGADALAWLPVFFLYFSERVTLAHVLWLEVTYFATVVVLEVPSGWFSDRWGRRRTLLLSTLAMSGAYTVFLLAQRFEALLLGQLLLALGMTFRSGTETALHYDTLAALGRTQEFARREARAERAGLSSLALATLLGGFAGLVDLRLPYALSLAGALVSLVLVLRFAEPAEVGDWAPAERNFARQVWHCGAYLRRLPVLWLLGFYVALDVFMHVPYEFYQPYLKLLEQDVLAPGASPAASGVLLAATMALAAWVAGHSVSLGDRLGLATLLLGALAVQCAIIGVMATWLSLATASAVLLRNVPDAVTHAPFNATLGTHLASAHRATFLSLLNLISRIGVSGLFAGLAWGLAPGAVADWPTLRGLLLVSATLALAAWVVLALTVRALRA